MRGLFGVFRRLDFLFQTPWNRLWLGVPAIAFLIAAGYMAFGLGAVSGAQTPESVIKRAQVEVAKKKHEEARIILERYIGSAGDQDEAVMHQYAAVLIGLGQMERGMGVLKKLAPEDKIGHIPSQLAYCQIQLRNPDLNLGDIKNIETRLNRILSAKRDSDETKAVMVDVMLQYATRASSQEQRIEYAKRAITLLVALAGDRRPWLGQPLGELYTALKDDLNAARWLQTAAGHFKSLAGTNIDDHQSRVSWARAEIWMSHFDEAYQILVDGLSNALAGGGLKPDENEKPEDFEKRKINLSTQYRLLIGDVRARHVERLKATDPSNLKERMARLNEGLDYNPRNQVLLQHLVELSEADGVAGAEMSTKLKELQAKGTNNSSLHFVLGVNAFLKNQQDQAKFHFERALETDPVAPVVANNLAYLLCKADKPDLKRARVLIDAALEKLPNNIDFIDTRGMIRVKQGEYKEGIKDLESVNQIRGGNLDRHELLAVAYDQLKDPETAGIHRKQAATFRSEMENSGLKATNRGLQTNVNSSESNPFGQGAAEIGAPVEPKATPAKSAAPAAKSNNNNNNNNPARKIAAPPTSKPAPANRPAGV